MPDTSQPGTLAGRTAVVTGASSGIGRAIAEALGAAGAYVALAGRTPDAMAASVERIAGAGGSAEAHTIDVRDPAAVTALVDGTARSTGRLDVMVNNAGVSYPEKIADADPEHWRAMLETNVLGLLAGCQAAVRAMRATGSRGHIVNISSVAAQRRYSGVYGATKHAVNCISNTLRAELMGEPIQVVTIMPGAIATSFARNFDPAVLNLMAQTAGAGPVELTQGERIPDDVLENARSALSDHLCSPEDVAEAVLWSITRPASVHLAELVVRPNRDLDL